MEEIYPWCGPGLNLKMCLFSEIGTHMIKIESKRSLGQIVFVLSLLRSWAVFDDYRFEYGVHIGN